MLITSSLWALIALASRAGLASPIKVERDDGSLARRAICPKYVLATNRFYEAAPEPLAKRSEPPVPGANQQGSAPLAERGDVLRLGPARVQVLERPVLIGSEEKKRAAVVEWMVDMYVQVEDEHVASFLPHYGDSHRSHYYRKTLDGTLSRISITGKYHRWPSRAQDLWATPFGDLFGCTVVFIVVSPSDVSGPLPSSI